MKSKFTAIILLLALIVLPVFQSCSSSEDVQGESEKQEESDQNGLTANSFDGIDLSKIWASEYSTGYIPPEGPPYKVGQHAAKGAEELAAYINELNQEFNDYTAIFATALVAPASATDDYEYMAGTEGRLENNGTDSEGLRLRVFIKLENITPDLIRAISEDDSVLFFGIHFPESHLPLDD